MMKKNIALDEEKRLNQLVAIFQTVSLSIQDQFVALAKISLHIGYSVPDMEFRLQYL